MEIESVGCHSRDGASSDGKRVPTGPVVHYFCYYVDAEIDNQRGGSPAAYAKIEYTKGAVAAAGSSVRLVSTAVARHGAGRLPRVERQVGAHETHIYLPSLRLPWRSTFPLTQMLMWWHVVLYLLVEVKREDVVLAYHSPGYQLPFRIARRLKRFRLILEVNEVYGAVWHQYAKGRAHEERFIRSADGYLFVSSLAANEFSNGKSYAISHGTYTIPDRRAHPNTDGKIHAVYAGVVDFRQGAELAARTAQHLPGDYVVDILGFGADNEIAKLRETIAEVNEKSGREAVVFHGQKRGRELTDFLHRCHLGLSTHSYSHREIEATKHCFPSKVSLYATHGLPVVSSRLDVVAHSPLAALVTFYDQDTSEAIADAVVRCMGQPERKDRRSPLTLIHDLDGAFRRDLGRLIFPHREPDHGGGMGASHIPS